MYLGGSWQGCHLLPMPKYSFFRDFKKLISNNQLSNKRFKEIDLGVVQFSVFRGSGTLKLCQNICLISFNIKNN